MSTITVNPLSATSPVAKQKVGNGKVGWGNWLRGGRKKSLISAIQSGDLNEVNRLIAAGADVNLAKGGDGNPALLTACTLAQEKVDSNINIVRSLLAAGANVNGTNEITGLTPLIAACEKKNPGIVRELLARGADTHLTMKNGYTCLMAASYLPPPKVNIPGVHIYSLFDPARSASAFDIVTQLLSLPPERCPDVNSKTNDYNTTPLMYACRTSSVIRPNIDIVKSLLAKGADPNAVNTVGYSPFIFACENPDLDLIKVMVEAGANVNPTDTNITPLFAILLKSIKLYDSDSDDRESVNERFLDMFIYLCEHGANKDIQSTNGSLVNIAKSNHEMHRRGARLIYEYLTRTTTKNNSTAKKGGRRTRKRKSRRRR
jgi:ankyrin repeat protein